MSTTARRTSRRHGLKRGHRREKGRTPTHRVAVRRDRARST